MKGAEPATTPEFLCQVTNGLFNTPSKNLCWNCCRKLSGSSFCGKFSGSQGLQETLSQYCARRVSDVVKIGIFLEAGEFNELDPTSPGSVNGLVSCLGS